MAGIGGQPVLRSRGDDAARGGQADGQLESGRGPEAAAQERVLGEGLAVGAVVEHEVGAKAPDVPVRIGGHGAQMRQRAGGDEVDRGEVVVRPGRAGSAPSAGASERSRRTRRPSSSESAASISAPTSALPSGSVMRSGGCSSRVVEELGPARAQARIGRAALVRDPLAGHWRRRRSTAGRLRSPRGPMATASQQLAEHRLDRIAPDGQDSHRRIFAERPDRDEHDRPLRRSDALEARRVAGGPSRTRPASHAVPSRVMPQRSLRVSTRKRPRPPGRVGSTAGSSAPWASPRR